MKAKLDFTTDPALFPEQEVADFADQLHLEGKVHFLSKLIVDWINSALS